MSCHREMKAGKRASEYIQRVDVHEEAGGAGVRRAGSGGHSGCMLPVRMRTITNTNTIITLG